MKTATSALLGLLVGALAGCSLDQEGDGGAAAPGSRSGAPWFADLGAAIVRKEHPDLIGRVESFSGLRHRRILLTVDSSAPGSGALSGSVIIRVQKGVLRGKRIRRGQKIGVWTGPEVYLSKPPQVDGLRIESVD